VISAQIDASKHEIRFVMRSKPKMSQGSLEP